MISRIIIIFFALFLNIKIIAPFLKITNGILLFWVALSFLAILSLLQKKATILIPTKGKVFVALFLFLIGLALSSLLYTGAPNYGAEKIFFFVLKTTLTIPLAMLVSYHKNLFVKSYLIGTLPIIFYVLMVFGSPVELFMSYGIHDRLGMNDGPIAVGRYFGMMSIVYFILMITSKKNLVKYLLLTIFIITLSYTILSGSKGPLLALLITVFIYYLFKLKKTNSINKLMLKACIIIITVLPLVQLNFQLGSFVESRFLGNTRSYSSRVELYELAQERYMNSNILFMILGNGAGDYGSLEHGKDESGYPHNLIIEIFYEYGLVGFLILSILILNILRKVYFAFIGSNRYNAIIMSIVLYFIINSMFSGDVTYNFSFVLYYIIFYFTYEKNETHTLIETKF